MPKKLLYGVGICDVPSAGDNGKELKSYKTWSHMLERCYSEKRLARRPTYRGCVVCGEWKYFSKFKEWYDAHCVEDYDLDKDFLGNGKLYSPATCCFVPHSINTLMVDSGAKRGSYPQGVSYRKQAKRFEASLRIRGKKRHLGYFDTISNAMFAYFAAKRRHIENWAPEILTLPHGDKIMDGVWRLFLKQFSRALKDLRELTE